MPKSKDYLNPINIYERIEEINQVLNSILNSN